MMASSTSPLVMIPPSSGGIQGYQPKFRLLIYWLKLCSYTTCICYKLFILLWITAALGAEYYVILKGSSDFAAWYTHVIQISWCLSSFITFYVLQRNIVKTQDFTNKLNKTEYHICVVGPVLIIIILRFVPFSMESVCDHHSYLDYIANIAGFTANFITMYSLNFVVLYLSLKIVTKYDKLMTRIQNVQDIDIREIKNEFDIIKKDVVSFKNKYEFVVSISCLYHIICASTYAFVWITEISNEFWAYCSNNDEYTAVLLVLTRFCVRMFALIYGILRINHKPKQLAKLINDHCDWEDQKQQFQIQRLTKSLTEFHDKFKILCIGIEWKHFAGIMISAIASSIGTVARKKFG